MARSALLCLLAAAIAAVTPGARAQLPAEPLAVEELPPQPAPHWVWVNDISLSAVPDGRAFLVDGDSGRMLGMLSTGYSFTSVMVPRNGGVIYAPETYFARGTRGTRTDVVTIYDTRHLLPAGEIEIPPKRASVAAGIGAQAMTDDGRFLLIYNFTPSQSLTVVDTRARKFVGEIETAGCALVYPISPRSVFSICADGSLLVTELTEAGLAARRTRTPVLFDVQRDPLSEKGVRLGDSWLFASFDGVMHPLRSTPADVRAEPPWPLFTGTELAQQWRTAGLQHLAVHRATGRLFAVVHQGSRDTHKEPGAQAWVYDLASRKRVQVISFHNKAESIEVSQDAQPLLFAYSLEKTQLDIYDANSGNYLRSVGSLGQTPMILTVP